MTEIDDPETRAAEATVLEMLQAASRYDAEAVDRLISRDLLLYKVGRVKGRADLLAAIGDFAQLGGRAEYQLSDMVARRDGELCVLTFRSSAIIEVPGQPVRRPKWLETVVLERSDRWRVVFYHSTDEAGDEQ